MVECYSAGRHKAQTAILTGGGGERHAQHQILSQERSDRQDALCAEQGAEDRSEDEDQEIRRCGRSGRQGRGSRIL